MGSNHTAFTVALTGALVFLFAMTPLTAQSTASSWAEEPPVLGALVDFGRTQSDLRVAVQRFEEDRRALGRRYDIPYSALRRERMRVFYSGWLARLGELDFAGLNQEGQVDYVLLRTQVEFELETLAQEEIAVAEMEPLVPFQPEEAIDKTILVVGGGITGLTAAREAAKAGYDVRLVEKTETLGGWLAMQHRSVPTRPPYRQLEETGVDPLIADVESSEGTLGKLVQDKELYDELVTTLQDAKSLLQDVRENPRRYFKVSIF